MNPANKHIILERPFDLRQVPGLELWHSTKDPADIIAGTGAGALGWKDRSGKSNETVLAGNAVTPAVTAVNTPSLGAGSWTISVLYEKLGENNIIRYTANGNPTANPGLLVFDDGTNKPIRIKDGTNGIELANAPYMLRDGVRRHLVVTYTAGGNAVSYSDGSALDTVSCAAITGTLDGASQVWNFLANVTGASIGCVLQRPAIYNRALSAAEVAALNTSGGVPVAADYYGAGIGTAINAGSFVTGKRYRIASAGDTDFTLVGAANSSVGTEFIATGAGAGTGNATAIGLLAYWDFSTATRGATTVTDSSGNSCVLTTSTGARISGARDAWQGTAASQPTNLPWSGTNYGWLPGVNSNYFSTPDASANQFTIDIAVRVFFTLIAAPGGDVTALSKWNSTGNQIGWALNIDSSGAVIFYMSTNGSAILSASSTATVAHTAGTTIGIGATRKKSDGTVTFYSSTDGVTWNTLGNTSVIAANTAIFASNSDVRVGGIASASSINIKVWKTELFSDLAFSTRTQAFIPSEATDGAASWTSSTGEVWTVNTSGGLPATIVGRPGLTTDGVNDYMKTPPFPLVQPEWVVMVGRQVSWTSGDVIYDGDAANSLLLAQITGTPKLDAYAGAFVGGITSLDVGVTGIVTSVLNGSASIIQLNRDSPTTGNGGASNANGFTIGTLGNGSGSVAANIVFNELAIFSRAPSAAERLRVINYMARKWGL